MFQEYDLVKTLVPKENAPAGTLGVVVSLYSSGPACEVEVWDGNNYPFDVITYEFAELELVER